MKKGNKGKYIIVVLIAIALLLIGYYIINNAFHSEIIFEFSDTKIELKVGENTSISYQLNDNGDIIWESDNNSVVNINDGIATGLSLGNAKITGTVIRGEKKVTRSIEVTTYIGEKDIALNEIIIPEGDLYITKGKSYQIPITYNPENSYINKIEYNIVDSSIVSYDGSIIANNIGVTEITINVNNISKKIIVHVIEKEIEPIFSPKITEVTMEENITLKPQETKKIEYKVEPSDAYIERIKWESSNEKVVTIDNGIVTAISPGEAIVKLTVNGTVVKEIKIMVIIPVTGISLKTNSKLVLKVGNKETIKTLITPSNATNKKVKYTNSNSNIVIDNNGIITGVKEGSGTITIKTEDGNKQATVSYVVNPQKGLINGDGGVWGYTSSLDKTPERADTNYFRELANKGIGVLSENTYIYGKYKYDISKSTLYADNRSILMRMYYPPGVDLSEVNTFTFFSGTGEAAKNFGGFQNHLDKNRNEMRSSGIIIMVSTPTGLSYNSEDAIHSTEFIKSIVNQKNGVHNAIGGYSGSGEAAGKAANNGKYDRLIICHSYFKSAYTTNVKNLEVTVYSPRGDFMVNQTTTALNNMKTYGYTNVTLVTNNNSLNRYSSSFLVINPGNKMGSGHGYVNITSANVFSYANR